MAQIKSSVETQTCPSNLKSPFSQILHLKEAIYLKTWNVYCYRRGKLSVNTNYAETLPVGKFCTLEEFFHYFISLKIPSECYVDTKIMVFQDGCRPMWEDWLNSGLLLIQFKNKEDDEMDVLDQLWEYLLFMMVGNQLDNQVVGICMCKREKISLIEIWLKREDSYSLIAAKIEALIKQDLQHLEKQMKNEIKVKYKAHKHSITVCHTRYRLNPP